MKTISNKIIQAIRFLIPYMLAVVITYCGIIKGSVWSAWLTIPFFILFAVCADWLLINLLRK